MSVILISTGPVPEHSAPGHPERPDRVAAILDHIAGQEDLASLPRFDPTEADGAAIELVHTSAHAGAVRAMAQRGGGWFDGDTFCGPGSQAAALRSVGFPSGFYSISNFPPLGTTILATSFPSLS